MRYSKQREVVYDVVYATSSHPDASYVYCEARKVIPNISLGTVYRNLSELCAVGRLRKISVSDSAERYDACITAHPHFVCQRCGSVIDLPNESIALSHNVFGVRHAEITFYGVCEKCHPKN